MPFTRSQACVPTLEDKGHTLSCSLLHSEFPVQCQIETKRATGKVKVREKAVKRGRKTVMLCIRTGRLHAAPQLRCREPPPPRCPATGSAKAGQHLTRGTLSKTPKYLRKPGQVEVSFTPAGSHLHPSIWEASAQCSGSWNIHPKLKPASQQAPHMCLEFLFSLFPLSFLRIAWQLRITKHLRKAYSIMKKNRKSNPRGNV